MKRMFSVVAAAAASDSLEMANICEADNKQLAQAIIST